MAHRVYNNVLFYSILPYIKAHFAQMRNREIWEQPKF